jgi:hypothetical protein
MIDIDALLARTDAFLNTMYVVREGFGLAPSKEHLGTCINYVDLQEMRKQFVEELTSTIITYVYAPARQERIRNALMDEGRDEAAAWRTLYIRARKKFRPSSLQGQFSELLLCNLLQHHFRAVPLVRKMSITTNPALERNGADAIHIAREGDGYRLYIGEAKTYKRKTGGLRQALSDAVTDIVTKHYAHHDDELDLYTYEDFVPEELEDIARQYHRGTLARVEVHLVCIVAYDEQTPVTGDSGAAKRASVMQTLRTAAAEASSSPAIAAMPAELLPRMNYILFPIQAMDDLIAAFAKELG